MAVKKGSTSARREDPQTSHLSNNNSQKPKTPEEPQEVRVAPEEGLITKHPLESRWQLWYYKPDKNRNWIDNLVKVSSPVDTVEDFWSLFNHIEVAANLRTGCDYCLFKEGIQPKWEDEGNKRGGRWLFTLMRGSTAPMAVNQMWLDVLLALIGEAFEESNRICGAVINVRKTLYKIGIWTEDKNKDTVLKIGKMLKEKTAFKQNISFEDHEATQSKQGSTSHTMFTI